MADGLNRVFLIGRLGAAPQLRFTQGGQAVMEISVATSESWVEKGSNQRKERTEWHKVVVWGARAEALAKILNKGDLVFVEGSLRNESWEDNQGTKRYATKVQAANIILTGGKKSGDGAQGNGGRGQQQEERQPGEDDEIPY